MPIRKAEPMKFTPKGLSDAYDSSDTFFGAARYLTNLIFDQSNPELVVPRPGVTTMTSFPGFSSPGVVSIQVQVGGKVYGLISTSRNAGKDEPFSYDIASNTFDTVSGVTNPNSPTTPATTGFWTPPTVAIIAGKVLFTHPGFASALVGVLDISTPSAPAWSATNTTTTVLPANPTSVSTFGNRAWYAVGNALYFSDAGVPLTISNASTQILTVGDSAPIRGQGGLPIVTTQSGVVQSLLIFKDTQVWQITGDLATTNLSLNFLSLTLGCSAPRTITETPWGVIFMANDSVYVVDELANVKPLAQSKTVDKGVLEGDIQAPFINCTTPSRAAAEYNASIFRISLDTVIDGVTTPAADFWFDFHRGRWSGPHTFQYNCASQAVNYFVLSSVALPGKLFKSQAQVDSTSVYLDAGSSYNCLMKTSTLPKKGDMFEKQIVESTIELASPGPGISYTVSAIDDESAQLGLVTINIPARGYLWGGTTWGGGLWNAALPIPATVPIPWTMPVVFQKVAYQVSFQAAAGAAIGALNSRYQPCGYTVQA
jgi:hypothetical protein